jgi:hypothetical protein
MLSAVSQRCRRALACCSGSLAIYRNATAVRCHAYSHLQPVALAIAWLVCVVSKARRLSSGTARHVARCVKARHVPPLGAFCELHCTRQYQIESAHTRSMKAPCRSSLTQLAEAPDACAQIAAKSVSLARAPGCRARRRGFAWQWPGCLGHWPVRFGHITHQGGKTTASGLRTRLGAASYLAKPILHCKEQYFSCKGWTLQLRTSG